jgi:hypothetical protein
MAVLCAGSKYFSQIGQRSIQPTESAASDVTRGFSTKGNEGNGEGRLTASPPPFISFVTFGSKKTVFSGAP